MSECGIKDRLAQLRSLREKLCSQQSEWVDGFAARDWIVSELTQVREMIVCSDHDHDEIILKLDEMLETLDPQGADAHAS